MMRKLSLLGLLWTFVRLALLFIALAGLAGIVEPREAIILLAIATPSLALALLHLQARPHTFTVLLGAYLGNTGMSLLAFALQAIAFLRQEEKIISNEYAVFSLILLAIAALGDSIGVILVYAQLSKLTKDTKDAGGAN